MTINFHKPKSKILQQYIEGYYFLSNKKSDPSIEYFTFPNNFSIISVIENVEITYSENEGKIKESLGKKIISEMICHYTKPIKLSYEGAINEITFYFKPLGLNAFLEKPLYNYTNTFFSSFAPYDDYLNTFSTILKETDQDKQCEMIENYWLSKFLGFHHPFLNEVIYNLKDNQNQYTISELAKKNNITRQNLTKSFQEHLGKSPSDFKKVERFRKALKANFTKNSKGNLTALGYDLLFYDQSHLIKDFRSLTGLSPNKFFKTISSNGNGEINWLFL